MDERSAAVLIGGEKYEMLLTTKATKQISARYGGLEHLGDKLMASENFDEALTEIIWLIVTLCNQPIMIYNVKHPTDQRELLTEDFVELMTSPADLADYKDAIGEALARGTARHIVSETDDKKN